MRSSIRTINNNQFLFFFGAIFLVVLVRSAWVSEDAYITLRTVDNFVNGYGLRWNVSERVQTYTSNSKSKTRSWRRERDFQAVCHK